MMGDGNHKVTMKRRHDRVREVVVGGGSRGYLLCYEGSDVPFDNTSPQRFSGFIWAVSSQSPYRYVLYNRSLLYKHCISKESR